MFKRFILNLFFVSSLFADIEIDPNIEKHLDMYSVNSLELIVQALIDKNVTKAKLINDKVLAKYPNNILALKNKEIIEKKLKSKFNTKSSFKDINSYYHNLYQNGNYEKIKELSDNLINSVKKDYPKLITAKVYFKSKEYDKAEKILNSVRNKSALEYIRLKGYICFAKHKYKCAKKYLYKLYSTTYDINDAYKLIETYIKVGDKKLAKKLIDLLLQQNPQDSKLLNFRSMLSGNIAVSVNNISKPITISEVEDALNNYKFNGKFDDLKRLVYVLNKMGQKQQAIYYINQYLLKHPNDDNAKLLYAKYLFKDNQFDKAIPFLETLVLSNNYKLKLQAKELLGLIYFKKGKYSKAKPLLEEISRLKSSPEINNALSTINRLSSNNVTESDYVKNNIVDEADKNIIEIVPKKIERKRVKIQQRSLDRALISDSDRRVVKGENLLAEINSTNIDFDSFFDEGVITTKPIKVTKNSDNVDNIQDVVINESIPTYVKNFINEWKKAWESRNLSEYMKYYASKYKKYKRWKARKSYIFNLVDYISVKISDMQLLSHQKQGNADIYKVRFYQEYSTNLRGDKGYKTLTIKCVDEQCKIIGERWRKYK